MFVWNRHIYKTHIVSRTFSLTNFFNQTFYDILGLKSSATSSDIKKKYYELCKKYHPDKNQSDPNLHKQFVRISEAYETLGNPNKRREYDNSIIGGGASSQHDTYGRYKSNARPYYNHHRNNPQSSKYYKQRAEYWQKYYKDPNYDFADWQRKQAANDEAFRRYEAWTNQKRKWDENLQKEGFYTDSYPYRQDRMTAYWDSFYNKPKHHRQYQFASNPYVLPVYIFMCGVILAYVTIQNLRAHFANYGNNDINYDYTTFKNQHLINSVKEKLQESIYVDVSEQETNNMGKQ